MLKYKAVDSKLSILNQPRRIQLNSPRRQSQSVQGQLTIEQFQEFSLPASEIRQYIVESLEGSAVKKVCLNPQIGEAQLELWADAAAQARKPVFLRIAVMEALYKHDNSFPWLCKRLADFSAAALLLMLLSPLLLVLMLLVRLYSPGPIFFQQWRVGQSGKLFRIFKFRTMVADAETQHHQVMKNQQGLHKLKHDPRITPMGRWMRKLSLDELPQLINVLRGEMSLVGPRPWALYDALRLSPDGQKRLNALPGITGEWQVRARSHLLELDVVNEIDLEYLRNWSLYRDLKILLLTIPRVIFGVGAC
ncbi:heterocyst development glycosyltransferase HepC [Chroogloeocystis siderophila]|jgi:lipopolysaccharide/colanic/teichoic acid biosynthesis glycosyltransferase|uniref:UDP-phosphate galactose phosphotransferase n=1 Tax=Chroogloeocystis siderophila 5.2 s.c.1 TaxID=247279 RepID=A0A1U7HGD9_9CHRO|nr:heterocyst development glycosyltransferase HepC [Chroogloeocystis siderophila]OKH22653.1 UDP-phosphate galactose phosphotransferase [Chroogloeocystis siderophila 5.2 s.c.1]